MLIMQVTTRSNVGGITQFLKVILSLQKVDQVYVTGRCLENEVEIDFSGYISTKTLIKISSMQRRINPLLDLISLYRLIVAIRTLKPDIIHSHMSKAGFLSRSAVLLAGKYGEVKTVHSFHGHVIEGYFNRFVSWLILLIERILARFTDAIICDARAIRDDLQRFRIVAGQSVTIFPGIIEKVSESPHPKSDTHTFKVLLVSRLEPVKGVLNLIRVAEFLQNEYPEIRVHFDVVGGGSLLGQMDSQIKERELPIQLHGWQSDVSRFYREADVLLSLSKSEGAPVSFMEANSFGTPVIATNVGGVGEIIEEGVNGFVVPLDVEEIAKKIVCMESDERLRDHLSASSLEFSRSHFMADATRLAHMRVYEELIKGGH